MGRGYLVAVTGSSWQLWVHVAVTGSIRGAYWKVATYTSRNNHVYHALHTKNRVNNSLHLWSEENLLVEE